MEIDSTGWLTGDDVFKVPSVRNSLLAQDLAGPLGVVWHWTAGACRNPNYSRILAESIRTYDRVKDRAASWHVVISKDGRIFQSVSFLRASWHVGKPGRIGGAPKQKDGKWDATAWDGRLFGNINAATVGIELENSGPLKKKQGKFYCWPFNTESTNEVAADRAVQVGQDWYDEFPDAQIQSAQKLLSTLALAYKWTQDVAQYGHFMFDPSRKEDPGPLWQQTILPGLLSRAFNVGNV